MLQHPYPEIQQQKTLNPDHIRLNIDVSKADVNIIRAILTEPLQLNIALATLVKTTADYVRTNKLLTAILEPSTATVATSKLEHFLSSQFDVRLTTSEPSRLESSGHERHTVGRIPTTSESQSNINSTNLPEQTTKKGKGRKKG